MTQYSNQASQSAISTLTVMGIPAPRITAVSTPSSPHAPGEVFNFTVTVRNDGGTGTVSTIVKNNADNSVLRSYIDPAMTSGTAKTYTFSIDMPSTDLTIKIECGYVLSNIYTQTDTWSSTYTIQVLVSRATTITLTITPTTANPDQPISFSGVLTITGGAGLANQQVTIKDGATNLATSPTTITTNSSGSFNGTFAAPAVGVHSITSNYAGSATGLRASVSQRLNLRIGGLTVPSGLDMLAPFIVGLIALGIAKYGGQ